MDQAALYGAGTHNPMTIAHPCRSRAISWSVSRVGISVGVPWPQSVAALLRVNARVNAFGTPGEGAARRGDSHFFRRTIGAGVPWIKTLTHAGLPLANARSRAPGKSSFFATNSPWPPKALATKS